MPDEVSAGRFSERFNENHNMDEQVGDTVLTGHRLASLDHLADQNAEITADDRANLQGLARDLASDCHSLWSNLDETDPRSKEIGKIADRFKHLAENQENGWNFGHDPGRWAECLRAMETYRPGYGNDQINDTLQALEEKAAQFELERAADTADRDTINIEEIGAKRRHLLYMQMEIDSYPTNNRGYFAKRDELEDQANELRIANDADMEDYRRKMTRAVEQYQARQTSQTDSPNST